MNSVEIEKKIRELVGHYLIKDYHVTVRRGDVILWLTDICKDLLHITDCIENSRKNYNLCEEKISDLLDKIKI